MAAQAFEPDWMERWKGLVNKNGVMGYVGRFFDADVLLEFGDRPYFVSFEKGRIDELSTEIGPETCYQFALRAPKDSWSKFVQPTPPPMYNDIWAMAHPLHGRLRIEGDPKVMWQNIRAFSWALDLMREV